MRLADYLTETGTSRVAFAESVGISGGFVTQLCNGEAWPGRDVAARIKNATDGKVTPDDFLPARTEAAE